MAFGQDLITRLILMVVFVTMIQLRLTNSFVRGQYDKYERDFMITFNFEKLVNYDIFIIGANQLRRASWYLEMQN